MSLATSSTRSPARSSSTLLLVAAWLVVLLPTAWGLEHTIENAMKLFTSPPANSGSAKPGS